MSLTSTALQEDPDIRDTQFQPVQKVLSSSSAFPDGTRVVAFLMAGPEVDHILVDMTWALTTGCPTMAVRLLPSFVHYVCASYFVYSKRHFLAFCLRICLTFIVASQRPRKNLGFGTICQKFYPKVKFRSAL